MSIIKLNEVYKPKKEYKVIVKTITYNQSKYIQDTLNGIALQKTDFPFVSIVLEDNSSDSEQDIIKIWLERECNMSLAEYYDIPTADVIITPHKTNSNCTFAIYFHKENLFRQKAKREEQVNPWRINSKYEALCEGDDYWTDPYKLQKQTNLLESNNSCGLCYTKAKVYNQKNNSFYNYPIGEKQESFEELLIGNKIPTLTTLYKIELYNKYINNIKPETKNWLMGDYPMWLWFSVNSKIIFLEEETSVYRLLENSASHCDNINKHETFTNSTREIRLFYLNIFNKSNLTNLVNDLYFRENMQFAERMKIRDKALQNLNKIKNKSLKECIKSILYKTNLGFTWINR